MMKCPGSPIPRCSPSRRRDLELDDREADREADPRGRGPDRAAYDGSPDSAAVGPRNPSSRYRRRGRRPTTSGRSPASSRIRTRSRSRQVASDRPASARVRRPASPAIRSAPRARSISGSGRRDEAREPGEAASRAAASNTGSSAIVRIVRRGRPDGIVRRGRPAHVLRPWPSGDSSTGPVYLAVPVRTEPRDARRDPSIAIRGLGPRPAPGAAPAPTGLPDPARRPPVDAESGDPFSDAPGASTSGPARARPARSVSPTSSTA